MSDEISKIPVLGIQNAGKTSLINTLQREFKSLTKIKPTKGIERTKISFLNKTIAVWDFGGQEKYREDYIKKKPEINFGDITDAFYVIDFQDQNSFNESISYFQEIARLMKENSPNATVNLLINKIDPEMEKNEEVAKLYQTLGSKFAEIANPLAVRVAQTTIFNPISVIRAFSKPLFGNTTLYDNFSMLFMEFVNSTGADFVMIFSSDLLEIGNFFSNNVDQQKMREVAHEIFRAFDEKKLKLGEISLQAGSEAIRMTQFEAGGQQFFFTLGYDVSKISDPSPILTNSINLLSEVRKFMKYF
jgi:GTPase SAR1 family protein